MGAFIGNLGGLIMIILIAVLLFKFITELCALKKSNDSIVKKVSFFTVTAVLIGFVYIVIGGYIYNFKNGAVSLFDIQTIWNMKPVSAFMTVASGGTYSSDWLLSDGIFPLYPVLVSLFSGLLYDMYIECAFYISFLSWIVTVTCLGLWLDKKYGYERAKLYIMLIMCIPGVFLLFLPSPFALFMALFSAFLLCFEYRFRVAMTVLAFLCIFTHMSGIVALAVLVTVYIYGWDKKYSDIVYASVILVSQLVLCVVYYASGIGCGVECWFLMIIPAIMALKYFDKNEISGKTFYNVANIVLVLISSFYLTAKIYQII